MMDPASDVLIKNTIEATLLPGAGRAALGRLRRMERDPADLFSMDSGSLGSIGFANETVAAIRARHCRAQAEAIHDRCLREGYQVLVPGGNDYPSLLKEIFDPPLLLYARGRMNVLRSPCIAIVGTRRPSLYGMQMAEGMAADLGERGITIVSGLARGIDGAAHRGCLGTGGSTVAVFGCGIDICYPREHTRLARDIAETGLLLSEYPPGTSPAPYNFPARNRIISGLSLGTVVVEARAQSGSLITARLAMEQNREVFAFPGNVTSPQSFGPNYLIKDGAKLVQSWRDIVEELSLPEKERLLKEKHPDLDPSSSPGLSEDARRIMFLLKRDKAVHFDEIYQLGGLDISCLNRLLLDLETSGSIRQLPGSLFVKTGK